MTFKELNNKEWQVVNSFSNGLTSQEEAHFELVELNKKRIELFNTNAKFAFDNIRFVLWNVWAGGKRSELERVFLHLELTEGEIRGNKRLYRLFNCAFRRWKDYDF